MLRDAKPGQYTREVKRRLRRIEVDECKRLILSLFGQREEVDCAEIWKRCKSQKFQERSIRLALRELPLKAEHSGFQTWVYRQISQK